MKYRYSFETERPITSCFTCPCLKYTQTHYYCAIRHSTACCYETVPASCPLTDPTGWISHPCEQIGEMPESVTTTASTGDGYITINMTDSESITAGKILQSEGESK